jgi:hypothetical protein
MPEVDPKLLALVTAISFGLNPIALKIGFLRGGRPDTAMIIGLAISVPMFLLLVPFAGGLHWEQVTVAAFVGYVWAGVRDGIRRAGCLAIDRSGHAGDGDQERRRCDDLLAGRMRRTDPPLRWAAVVRIVVGVALGVGRAGIGTVDVGVLAAVGRVVRCDLFLKFGLEADLPLTAAFVAHRRALRASARSGSRAHREPAFGLFAFAAGFSRSALPSR